MLPRRLEGEPVPVDALAVVAIEAEVERGERGHRPRDANGCACTNRHAFFEHGANRRRACVELRRLGRVGDDEALGVPDGAEVEARVEVVHDQLRRAAADVEHERSCRGLNAAACEPGLFLTADEASCEPVAPLDLAEKRLSVFCVAHGARRDGERALGAEPFERAAVVGEDVADARDRQGQEPLACVHAFAEPRDVRLAVHLVDAAVVDIRDEQARRVGAEVDRRDPHFRG